LGEIKLFTHLSKDDLSLVDFLKTSQHTNYQNLKKIPFYLP